MKIKFRKVSQKQNTVIKEVALVLFISLVGLMMHVGVRAQTDTVTATVTAQEIALSVTNGTVSYGTLQIGATANTTVNDGDNTQQAVNEGNVSVNFSLQGQDTGSWTLSGTTAAENYVHEFCDDETYTCDSSPTWETLQSASYTSLGTAVGVGATYAFDLQIRLPSSTSDYTQQSADVTVMAEAN